MNKNTKKGRPTRQKETSDKRIIIRLTNSEKQKLKNISTEINVPVAEYIRSKLFDYQIKNTKNLVALLIDKNSITPVYFNPYEMLYTVKTDEYTIECEDIITLEEILHGKYLSATLVILNKNKHSHYQEAI